MEKYHIFSGDMQAGDIKHAKEYGKRASPDRFDKLKIRLIRQRRDGHIWIYWNDESSQKRVCTKDCRPNGLRDINVEHLMVRDLFTIHLKASNGKSKRTPPNGNSRGSTGLRWLNVGAPWLFSCSSHPECSSKACLTGQRRKIEEYFNIISVWHGYYNNLIWTKTRLSLRDQL